MPQPGSPEKKGEAKEKPHAQIGISSASQAQRAVWEKLYPDATIKDLTTIPDSMKKTTTPPGTTSSPQNPSGGTKAETK